MKRRQLFEFGDWPGLRGWWREAYMDCLNFAWRAGGHYRYLLQIIPRWIAACADGAGAVDSREVLELGSGGGGPVDMLLAYAEHEGEVLPRIVLSDLHPSVGHYRELVGKHGPECLRALEVPVSADAVPAGSPRLRMFCSVFHHFTPDVARRVLADAVARSDGLLVVEPFRRDWRHFAMVLLAGPFIYMPGVLMGPRRTWRKLLVTLVIPIVPFMVLFDGCVSVMRIYREEEIRNMVPASERDAFAWGSGACAYMGGFRSTYCYAVRRAAVGD